MINTRFEQYKVQREIKRSGTEYTFKRYPKNEFDEPEVDQPTIEVGKLKGIFHAHVIGSGVYKKLATEDAAQVRNKMGGMILCILEDAIALQLQVGDITVINGKTYHYTGITDIQEWGLIGEVCLEVLDNGD